MTQVHGAVVTLKEGQIWKTKGPIETPFLDRPTNHVKILALGKEFVALQDIICESDFVTTVMHVDRFATYYALVLVKE